MKPLDAAQLLVEVATCAIWPSERDGIEEFAAEHHWRDQVRIHTLFR